MTEKDWKEIRELREEFMGTSKGIALGNLIAEEQRLKQIKQIVERFKSQYDHTSNLDLMVEIKEVLENG